MSAADDICAVVYWGFYACGKNSPLDGGGVRIGKDNYAGFRK